MLTILASTGIGTGTALSWGAARLKHRAAAMERIGGLVLIVGFVLLGAALPVLR